MNRTETARAFLAFCQSHAQLVAPGHNGANYPSIHGPGVDLVALLEPMVRDFPGAQTIVMANGEPLAHLNVVIGKARAIVYLNAPIDAPWSPPADALGAAVTREEHANNVGIAIRVAALGADQCQPVPVLRPDPFAPFETWADELGGEG